jgi:hypothetical protein
MSHAIKTTLSVPLHSFKVAANTKLQRAVTCKQRGCGGRTDASGNPMFPQVNGAQIKETRSEEAKEVRCKGEKSKKRRLKKRKEEGNRGGFGTRIRQKGNS